MTNQRTFEGNNLDDLLARVAADAGPGAHIVRADRVRSGGIAGFFARERYEVVVDIDEGAKAHAMAKPDGRQGSSEPGSRPPEATGLLALVDSVSSEEATQAAPPSLLPTPAPSASNATPSTEGSSFAATLAHISREAGLNGEDATVPYTMPVTPSMASNPRPDERDERDELAALGLPAGPRSGRETLPIRLLRSLEQLPAPPELVTQPGEVLVAVGDLEPALALAARLATEVGVDPSEIMVASLGAVTKVPPARRLGGPSEAEDHRRAWRSEDRPSVVAVCAAVGTDAALWASTVIAALKPSATWGGVDARHKPEDIAAWAETLGGLDALSVEHVACTRSPAAVLGSGIPVARLEGQPATPIRWFTLLAERLAA